MQNYIGHLGSTSIFLASWLFVTGVFLYELIWLTIYHLNLRKVKIYLLTSCNTEERIAQNIFGIAGGQEVDLNFS